MARLRNIAFVLFVCSALFGLRAAPKAQSGECLPEEPFYTCCSQVWADADMECGPLPGYIANFDCQDNVGWDNDFCCGTWDCVI